MIRTESLLGIVGLTALLLAGTVDVTRAQETTTT
jgi:hypothetical protein